MTQEQETNVVTVAVVPEPMNIIDKVKLMSSLAGACQDQNVLSVLKGLSNGEKIYEIFVKAIDQELSLIMNGERAIPKQMADLAAQAQQLSQLVQHFQSVISSFHKTPLVDALDRLNKNLGGRAPQEHQPTPQQVNNQQTQSVDSSGRSNRAAGLGSF